MELIYGSDGKVRSVKLLKGTADYETRPRQPELHPINHLYPLELSITHQHRVATPANQEYEDLVHMDVDSEFDFTCSNDDYTGQEDCDDPIDQAELAVPTDCDTGREDCNGPTDQAEPMVPTLEDSNLSSEPVAPIISNDIPPMGGVADAEQPIAEPLRYSNRGRRIIPKKGYEDFVT